jgi:hypothetical protein
MSQKIVLLLYYLLPLVVFGQTVVVPNYPKVEISAIHPGYGPESFAFVPGSLHFQAALNFAYVNYDRDADPAILAGPAGQDGDSFPQLGDQYPQPLGWKEPFGQVVYSEPITLKGMIRRDGNKMGASATGGLVYTGGDDAFAYAHYGRTGKLIWRTSPSPIANNMMATRWSLANFSIFRKAPLFQFQTN